MRAVVCQHAELAVKDRPAPTPAKGQVRLEVLRCGICGSDLHARTGTDDWADVAAKMGYDTFGRSTDELVFGHEFCGAIAEYGPKTKANIATGTPVVALPLLRGSGGGVDPTGLTAAAPGGYADQMLVEQSVMLPVPNGLAPDVATLTEPMAVGYHAVQRADVSKGQTAIVVGCGPVGLSVILFLKAKGVKHVVASDFSPGRRALAKQCGADVVIDPAKDTPWGEGDGIRSFPEALDMAVGALEKMGRLPIDWRHLWRFGDLVGATQPKHPVIFECVGVPGMIGSVIDAAPLWSRVVVVGVCVGTDQFTPAMAINKEIDLRFVLGYTPLEFRDTLHMLADGKVDPRPLLTARVGLEGVANAFTALGDPEKYAKILVDPSSKATEPEPIRI